MNEEESELREILLDLAEDVEEVLAELKSIKAKVERLHWKRDAK